MIGEGTPAIGPKARKSWWANSHGRTIWVVDNRDRC